MTSATRSSSQSYSAGSVSSNVVMPNQPPVDNNPNSVPTPVANTNPYPRSVEATDHQVTDLPTRGKRKTTEPTGKQKSQVWQCFTRPLLPDGRVNKELAKCNYCDTIVKASSKKNGTSSCWSHGRKCRLSPLYEVPLKPTQATLSRDNVTGAPQYHTFNQARLDLKCFKMIIMDELPFRHVEAVGFKEFMNEAQPRWKQPSRKDVARGVWELYQTEKAKMMSNLAQHPTRVSVTIDTWTSIQNINYMVITAHFMDNDWKLHKRILNFCSMTSQKEEDLGRVLEQCLRKWDITRVFTITVDNASAKDLAVLYMRKRLKHLKALNFDGEFLHLRCTCHIINLIVNDGISELEDGIDAIWHCVKFIRSSSSRLDKFREFSVLENMNKNANVPLDVKTRWNSTYLMLVAAIKYEKVFDRMSYEDAQFKQYFEEKDTKGRKRVGPPKEEDWRNAQAFVHFLKKFYQATLRLSDWKSVTANLLFSEMICLQLEIDKKTRDGSDPVLQRVACGMKAKFDKYWGSFEKMNKIIIIAKILDPRWKLQYQEKGFEKLGSSQAKVDEITKDLKNILLRMYDEYKECEASPTQTNNSDGVAAMEAVVYGGLESGIFVEMMRERLEEQRAMIANEVERYLADRYVHPLFKGFDIAQWWRENASVYPILSKLAKDIFAIPGSTVASENAFNLGKRVVDPFRSSLTPQMVEALVCTSDWLRAEQPNFYKEPTVEELELYQEIEELEKETTGRNLGVANSSTTTAS